MCSCYCKAKHKNLQVPDTVHKLGATTFVAAVTASTLSLLVPLLVRGLRDRSTPIKRKACLVIDNMSKLVNNPADAAVFLPRLQPGLDAVRKEVANPECREVADRAHATLLRVGAKGKVSTPSEQDKAAESKVHTNLLLACTPLASWSYPGALYELGNSGNSLSPLAFLVYRLDCCQGPN